MATLVVVFYVDGFLVGAPIPEALAFALLGVVVLVGFLHHADHGDVDQIGASTPVLSALAALTVLALSRGLSWPLVFSAAAVGSAGGLAELASRHRWSGLDAAVYCGAFAGMTSERVLAHPVLVLLAGAVAGLVLELLQSSWAGIGGKLGSTAFLGVFGVIGVASVLGVQGSGAQLHAFSGWERAALMLVALVSTQLTHWLSYGCHIGVVLGSALPSLLAGLLLPPPLAAAWMGAGFVGMTGPARLAPNPTLLLLAMGVLFGLFSLGFEPSLAGIGGDLGATAAMSVFAVLGLRRLLPGCSSQEVQHVFRRK